MHSLPASGRKLGRPSSAGVREVRVLARGLAVLRAFTPRNEWLSSQQIADKTSLPRPTASRIASNLANLGYLVYSADTGRYRLGLSVLALGYGALTNLDIRGVARPLMQRMADEEDALVVLASRDAMSMVCEDVCHSSRSVFTLRVNVGSRLSLPYSAMGLALIGSMEAEERAVLCRQIWRDFKKEQAGLQALIANATKQMERFHYCTTLGTLERGINGMSVVIDTPGAPHRFALGLAGPDFKFPVERLEKDLGPKLLAIKQAIESRLAFSAPASARET